MDHIFKENQDRELSPIAIAQRLGIDGELTEHPSVTRSTVDGKRQVKFSFPGATLTDGHKAQLDRLADRMLN